MDNPVLQKEIWTRFRSRKAKAIQLAVGIPAGVILAISYWRLIVGMLSLGSDYGDVWVSVGMLQLVLLCFLTPGLLCNAVSQEREQRTWSLLLITRLSPWQILSGKLIARLLPIPILMIVFVPFMAFSASVSDLGWKVVFGTYLVIFACVILFAIQALFWSWLLRRTSVATAASYGTVFALTAGTAIFEGLIQSITSRYEEESFLMMLNPFYAMGKLLEFNSDVVKMDPAIIMSTIYIGAAVILFIIMKSSLEAVQPE